MKWTQIPLFKGEEGIRSRGPFSLVVVSELNRDPKLTLECVPFSLVYSSYTIYGASPTKPHPLEEESTKNLSFGSCHATI